MPSTAVVILASLGATYALLWALAYLNQQPNEPPAIAGSIPFISPLIGLTTEKENYYIRMRQAYGLPIYTLRMPGPRTYVVNSLRLIQLIDRHIHTIAFTPIELRAVDKTMGASKETLDKIGRDQLLADKGYFISFPRNVAAGASPGPGLDALNRTAIETIAESLDKLAANGATTIELFDWVRHEVFAATMEATYGPHNPFRRPENEKAWFTFEPGLMVLLVDFLPGILAKECLKARESLISEFREYFQQERHLEGSLFVRLRHEHNVRFGLGVEDTAHTEVGQVNASISNTVPGAFWALWEIFATSIVFEDCQREALRLVQTDHDGVCTIDLAKVRTDCPILLSTWQEVLRFHGTSISARLVQKDTVIDNQYLLKKDSMVIMPTSVTHTDKSIWGPTANQFDHKRFLKSKKGSENTVPAAAFRGFGGGAVLCPGRHFVSTEILAFAALLLVRFNVRPVKEKWIEPKKDYLMNTAFPMPKNKVYVELTPKDRMKWKVIFSDNSKGINLTREDVDGIES
ncbi:cytochrome P450 [Coniella lustricola]|uniref:Cytochrome P450 n=1 Tax=Coniella lustricola TaxID=2025994 RepID=A0A2T2ZSX7_9PEZI|nr:cytochrome P450 [Coniella lustricola]